MRMPGKGKLSRWNKFLFSRTNKLFTGFLCRFKTGKIIFTLEKRVMLDMILMGMAYVIMVYFMVVLMKKRNFRFRDDEDDDDDGGISISPTPDLDLPPGVSLPDGTGPAYRRRIEEPEEMLA